MLIVSVRSSQRETKKEQTVANDYSVALTTRQVSERLGVGVQTVYKLVDSGTLKAFKFGARLIRIRADEVERLLNGGPVVNE
jgi:excisionase family DNA binding protein